MKVLLVCAAGMSTSMLMKKMEKYAATQGIDFSVSAVGAQGAGEACEGADCVLLGPQVTYQKDNVQRAVGDLPVAVIPASDYGLGNCPNIFKLIDSLIA